MIQGDYEKYQTKMRVSAAQRTEGNRCAGGRKTQKFVAKSWNVSQGGAKSVLICLLTFAFFMSDLPERGCGKAQNTRLHCRQALTP